MDWLQLGNVILLGRDREVQESEPKLRKTSTSAGPQVQDAPKINIITAMQKPGKKKDELDCVMVIRDR